MTETLADKPHILVVDDDDRIRSLLIRYLRDHDMMVAGAANAGEARILLADFAFDLLILDVMMPGESGLSLLADLRRTRVLPVLMLTALGEPADRITGFETGADDYLPKPFDPKELLLRIKAILRRQQAAPAALRDDRRIIGKWRYDPRKGELLTDSVAPIRLTPVENTLLKVLSTQAGRILSREDLARLCALEGQERAIDVQVTRLRRKIEDDPANPRLLQTLRGKGYILYAEEGEV